MKKPFLCRLELAEKQEDCEEGKNMKKSWVKEENVAGERIFISEAER